MPTNSKDKYTAETHPIQTPLLEHRQCWRLASCLAASDAEEPCFSGSVALGLHHHVEGSGPSGLPGYLLPIMESENRESLDLRQVSEGLASHSSAGRHPSTVPALGFTSAFLFWFKSPFWNHLHI